MSVIPTEKIKSIQFSVQSDEDRKLLSYVEVTNSTGIENGISKPGSLYDRRMGTVTNKVLCSTCNLDVNKDPGHFGHIKFAVPIFHISFIDIVKNILMCTCFKCGNMLVDLPEILSLPIGDRIKVCKDKVKNKKICTKCKFDNDIKYDTKTDVYNIMFKYKNDKGAFMNPQIVKDNFRKLRDIDIEMLGLSPKFSRPEWFIFDSMLVVPPPFRPVIFSNEGNNKSEDNIFKSLSTIIKTNTKLEAELNKNNDIYDISSNAYQTYKAFCMSVASYITNKYNQREGGLKSIITNKPLASIKEIISSKNGLVREKIMGKRVDYSGRSVISAETKLNSNELGVPLHICMILLEKEVVSKYNIQKLRGIVKNGPNKWPGAKDIIKGDRRIHLIDNDKILQKMAEELQYGDIIYRHLMDGDKVIFNRQPTLHKLSILGFDVVVMPGCKSFRLPTSVTTPFNADYDGDEMNIHKNHSMFAKSEIRNIMYTNHHFIDPSNSDTIIQPIQDNILSLYFMSLEKDIKLSKCDYLYIVNTAKYFNMIYKKEYTVGDLFLSIFPSDLSIKKGNLNIINGKFISGVLDKKNVSIMMKIIYSYYTRNETVRILNALQRISDTYLAFRGYSVNIDDYIIDDDIKNKIKDNISDAIKENNKLINDFNQEKITIPLLKQPNEYFEELAMNIAYKCYNKSNEIIDEHINNSKTPTNFIHMVRSKSKGKAQNIYQMMGFVGQQITDGTRIDKSVNNRSLPHFLQYDDSLQSRGFITRSYGDGLTPEQNFTLAAAARLGVISSAHKTAKTGYIARRLAIMLSNAIASYDGTIRYNNKDIISFSYGGFGFYDTFLHDNNITLHKKNKQELIDEFIL